MKSNAFVTKENEDRRFHFKWTKMGRYINQWLVYWWMMGVVWGYADLQPLEDKRWCLQFRLAGMWGLVLESWLQSWRMSLPSVSKSLGRVATVTKLFCRLHLARSTSWFSQFDSLRRQRLKSHCGWRDISAADRQSWIRTSKWPTGTKLATH